MTKRKTVPLATAAAVSLSMFGAPAQALDTRMGPLNLKLDLSAALQGAVFDAPGTGGQDSDIAANYSARLHVEWISPNSWVFGARGEVDNGRRRTEDLQADEIYGYVATPYGRVELGEQDSPADTMAFHAPTLGLGQVRGDFSRYAGSQALLSPLDSSDAFKAIYLSPPIRGFRVGASYAPSFQARKNDPNPRRRTRQTDVIEAAAQYVVPVGDWSAGLSASYVTGNADPITERADLNSWSVGGRLQRDRLTFGAAYVSRGDSNRLSDTNQWEANYGVSWRAPSWGAALSGATNHSLRRDRQSVGVGGFFNLTEYLVLRADVVYFDEKRVSRRNEDGVVAVGEIGVHF